MQVLVPDTVTSRQLEYIGLLSSYFDSQDIDKKVIQRFLDFYRVERLADLTKHQASSLIDELQKNREVEYTFKCGKKRLIRKQEHNCFTKMGDLEACLHACPDDLNVHQCKYWAIKEIE